MGVIGLVFSGIIVLAITPTLYANVPDSADVAKMFIEETTKLQGCGEDSACRHASEQALKTIEWYQKQNTARGTTQLFGMVLIILPAIAGVLSLRNS